MKVLSNSSSRTEMSLKIPSDTKYLSLLRECVRQISLSLGMSRADVLLSQLALTEAFENVCVHAYKLKKDEMVEIDIIGDDEKFEISLKDKGEGYDFDTIKIPSLHEYVEKGMKRGLGLYFISTIMDNLDYKVKPTGNEFRMVKCLKRA